MCPITSAVMAGSTSVAWSMAGAKALSAPVAQYNWRLFACWLVCFAWQTTAHCQRLQWARSPVTFWPAQPLGYVLVLASYAIAHTVLQITISRFLSAIPSSTLDVDALILLLPTFLTFVAIYLAAPLTPYRDN